MIKIKKSPTADTRTCKYRDVSKEQLLNSSQQHIKDVQEAMKLFAALLLVSAQKHDFTKLSHIDEFHRDFKLGFKETPEWYKMHLNTERHHIDKPEGVRLDVNLIDVLEHISDCIMSGLARSGAVYELKISNEVLQQAFQNTVRLLKNNVELEG